MVKLVQTVDFKTKRNAINIPILIRMDLIVIKLVFQCKFCFSEHEMIKLFFQLPIITVHFNPSHPQLPPQEKFIDVTYLLVITHSLLAIKIFLCIIV